MTTPGVQRVIAHGPTKSSILLDGGLPVDLRVVEEGQFAAALNYFTGSKSTTPPARPRKKNGFETQRIRVVSRRIRSADRDADEEAIYRRLGLHYIEPEMRENMARSRRRERARSAARRARRSARHHSIANDLQRRQEHAL